MSTRLREPLPTSPLALEKLAPDEIEALHEEIRELALQRDAVILAHNYQVPEVQAAAHYIGDSLGLARKAAEAQESVIAFCGVHFMAESASILCPEKTVLLPDLDAGCSLADSINAEDLAAWQAQHPGSVTVMYVNTTAAVKALTDYCVTSSNAVKVVQHVIDENGWQQRAAAGETLPILFGPDMWLGSYVEKELGVKMHVWDGECHVHAGIRPADIDQMRADHPGADFLIHPECGCSTQVMEFVAAGDVDTEGVHMLSTGKMLDYAREHVGSGGTAIVATETGMLHGLQQAAPDINFVAANPCATCRFMKMITLPKLRDCLRDMSGEVRVDPEVAARALLPIERMVAIG